MKKFKLFISNDCKKLLENANSFPTNKFYKQIDFLKENPQHPSLQFKKIKGFWSIRIDKNFRMLAEETDDELTIFWVGDHRDYEKEIKRL